MASKLEHGLLMMVISFIALLFVTSCLLVVSYPFRTIPESLLAFCNYCLAQIVLLSIFLSETFGISTKSLWIAQFVMTALAVWVWVSTGKPKVFCPTQFVERFRGSNQKVNWLAAGLAALAAMLLAINVEFFRSLPSMNKDALSYHLPRAYYWLQQGSLHYLPYSDFRWTEFPPNSSIILMWLMAAGVGYEWMHVPQAIGALMISLGVYRLTILCGGNRLAAVCASIICVGFPATIYQMGTSGNDLIVGGLVVSGVAFFVQVFEPSQGVSAIRRATVLTAISVGLGVGTKWTFLLVLPGMLLFAVGALFALRWNTWWPRISGLLVVGAIACAALGSYNYVQNVRDHGSPTFSKAANDIMATLPASTLTQRLLLSVYQALSWHGIQKKPDELLPTLQRETIFLIDKWFGLGFDKVAGLASDSHLTEFTTNESLAAFGIFGFLILLGSPPIGIFWLYQFIRTKNFVKLLQSGLIFIGWSALMLLFINTPWIPTSIRYLILFIPLLVASVVCLDFVPGWLRNICYVLVSIFSLWVMYYCIVAESSRASLFAAARDGKRPLHFHLDGRWLPQIDVLKSAVPAGAQVGYAGRLDSWAFALPRELPIYKYALLQPGEIDSALKLRRVDAVISELYPAEFSKALPLPGTILLPKQRLHVRDPAMVLSQNLKAYGLTLQPEHNLLTLTAAGIEAFSNVNRVFPTRLEADPRVGSNPSYQDKMVLLLPVSLLDIQSADIRVTLPLDASFPLDQISKITCNFQEVAFSTENNKLAFIIPNQAIEKSSALQTCEIAFRGAVSVILKGGDNSFPNAICFDAPLTLSVVDQPAD
jgi:hypothetical protein